MPNKVQCSKSTAEALIAAGKETWIEPRLDEIRIKGKGLVKSYWVKAERQYTRSVASQYSHASNTGSVTTSSFKKKQERLVAWNVEVLSGHLRRIVARRNAISKAQKNVAKETAVDLRITRKGENGHTALDEAEDVIKLPTFDPSIAALEADPDTVDLGEKVMSQLWNYVSSVADTYQRNPFHNFEHASHVAMSVDKLLKRIVAPDIDVHDGGEASRQKIALGLHDYTYGITSDPLTHFAVVFSALIHDADHRGVSNGQLGIEIPELVTIYKNKSIAEQNSIDLGWGILMSDEYKELRACIYADETEMNRFRQLVINVVLATDIFDKELNDLRKDRWRRAFAEQLVPSNSDVKPHHLKATIVIEHLIQASDVSHTMVS